MFAELSSDPLDAAAAGVRGKLTAAGFSIAGEYAPYPGARVIALTHPLLLETAARTRHGGLGAAVHVSLTEAGGGVQVVYLNPEYLAAAYRLDGGLTTVDTALKQALGERERYGAGKGRSAEALRRFRYMVGMETFDDPYRLGTHASHADAVAAVEANLRKQVGGTAQVYRIDVPGTEQVLFGVGRAAVKDKRANDKHILADTVDERFQSKTTAYLPYQVLVDGREVIAPHMRFRMAVWHPELTMVTFGRLMSSPGAVEELLRQVAGGRRAASPF